MATLSAKNTRFAALTRGTPAPANDGAPRRTLKLQDVVATVEPSAIRLADDAEGRTYSVMEDATVRIGESETVRTVVAPPESYELVRKVILAGETIVATLANSGAAMRVVGVVVDGAMVLIDQDDRAAA